MPGDRHPTIVSIGALEFRNPATGAKTGVVDVCRDTNSVVHVRVNRMGDEAVMLLTPVQTIKVATLLLEAIDPTAREAIITNEETQR